MDRPEGAVTPKELEALLASGGKVRVYAPMSIFKYFQKKQGLYYVHYVSGDCATFDFNTVSYVMTTIPYYHIFTNYWHYYAYQLKQRRAKSERN